jgi:hypothetical protein
VCVCVCVSYLKLHIHSNLGLYFHIFLTDVVVTSIVKFFSLLFSFTTWVLLLLLGFPVGFLWLFVGDWHLNSQPCAC